MRDFNRLAMRHCPIRFSLLVNGNPIIPIWRLKQEFGKLEGAPCGDVLSNWIFSCWWSPKNNAVRYAERLRDAQLVDDFLLPRWRLVRTPLALVLGRSCLMRLSAECSQLVEALRMASQRNELDAVDDVTHALRSLLELSPASPPVRLPAVESHFYVDHHFSPSPAVCLPSCCCR